LATSLRNVNEPEEQPMSHDALGVIRAQDERKVQSTSRSCYCCKQLVHEIDSDRLCVACANINAFASMIERRTDLDGDSCVDLAVDLVTQFRSHILQRLVDRGSPPSEFIADVMVGMVPADSTVQ
jgi:hypothetical protein